MQRSSLWKLVLGVILIVIGLGLLLDTVGIFPGLGRFIAGLWPIALVAIGLSALLAWRRGVTLPWQAGKTKPINQALGDTRSALLDLSGQIGALELDAAGAGSQDLIGGKVPATSRLQVESTGSASSIWLDRQGWGRLPYVGSKDAWELRLNPGAIWTLHLDATLDEGELDLTDLRVQELHLGGRSGEIKIKLPRRGQCVVAGAGQIDDLTVRVPDGVAARIHPPAGGTLRIDTGRFSLRDGVYESIGLSTAVDWAEINLDGSTITNFRVL